jgi:hypothetical protein
MIERGELERVPAGRDHADVLLGQARQHLDSVRAIVGGDPTRPPSTPVRTSRSLAARSRSTRQFPHRDHRVLIPTVGLGHLPDPHGARQGRIMVCGRDPSRSVRSSATRERRSARPRHSRCSRGAAGTGANRKNSLDQFRPQAKKRAAGRVESRYISNVSTSGRLVLADVPLVQQAARRRRRFDAERPGRGVNRVDGTATSPSPESRTATPAERQWPTHRRPGRPHSPGDEPR